MRLGAKQPERRRPLLIYNFGFSFSAQFPRAPDWTLLTNPPVLLPRWF